MVARDPSSNSRILDYSTGFTEQTIIFSDENPTLYVRGDRKKNQGEVRFHFKEPIF